MQKDFCVYIITNHNNAVLYTGVTSSLKARIWQHKNKTLDGFSKKYNLGKLVYYEIYADAASAITREKEVKKMLRKEKFLLVKNFNPDWEDLYDKI